MSLVEIRGTITGGAPSNGGAAVDRIEGYWRTADGDVLAATALSDADGAYRLRIERDPSDSRSESRLVVRVVGPDGATLGESEPIAAPKRRATVNLTLESGEAATRSEFHDLLAKVTEVQPPAALEHLTGRDTAALATKVGTPKTRVEALVRASRLASTLELPLDAAYGLVRGGHATDVEDVAALPPSAVERTLDEAARAGTIPPLAPEVGAAVLDRLHRERSDRTPVAELMGRSSGTVARTLERGLRRAGIETLADLRAAGGVAGVDELAELRDRPAAARLDGHARLSVVVPDVALQKKLIDRNLDRVSTIARTEPDALARKLRGVVDKQTAVALHASANAARAVGENALTELRTTHWGTVESQYAASASSGNGLRKDERISQFGGKNWEDWLDRHVKCECEDCDSAVSPLAYLADLLAYVKDNVQDAARPNVKIDWRYLERELHQPFGKLPVACDAVDAVVRQVRIAIEVLRAYNADNPPTAAQRSVLAVAERDYLRAAYRNLLTRAGTSTDELRLTVGAAPAQRAALAERLGLPVQVDHLAELALDTETAPLSDLEADIEDLFGLGQTQTPRFTPLPPCKLLQWRRARLRELWTDQDWPDDMPASGRPVIDPDVIGVDDLRSPAAPNLAFNIWKKRRDWVDARLDELAALTPLTVEDSVDWMYQPHQYPTSAGTETARWPYPKAELTDIYQRLQTGALDATTQTRFDKYGLSVDALNRLMELRRKAAAASDPRNPALEASDWAELRSILVQALKAQLFAAWLTEEQQRGLRFGTQDFWISQREPVEGDWPPVRDPQTPLVDPELIKPNELPDSAAGDRARQLYATRQVQLAGDHDDLAQTREDPAGGFEAMLEEALGSPLPVDLDQTLADLTSTNPTVARQAATTIQSTLFMTPDDFSLVMAVRAKDADTDVYRKPTAAEYEAVYSVLTSAYKVGVRYPAWVTDETTAGLHYYDALKAKLPQWRGPPEARNDWQQVFRLRTSAAIVDPDLIPVTYLVPTSAAKTIWTNRQAEIATFRAGIAGQTSLDPILQAALGTGIDRAALRAIRDTATRGESITRRLDQLHLAQAGFDQLLRVDDLLVAHQPVEPAEWDGVYDVLTQAWKTSRNLAWREAEQQASIILSPDHFRVPTPDPTVFPPPPPRELNVWRASATALLDWEDKMQARVDLDASVAEALAQLVGAVEQECLPPLRDALVTATRTPAGVGDKARWLSKRLIIDLSTDGCATTTRVAQAIVTIQGLVFLIRSGQIRGISPFEQLRLVTTALSTFDEDWSWMGSYATWRAAMFVFIHAEVLALPSLRKDKTPAFAALVETLRSAAPVSPAACDAAVKQYEDYFRDVCALDPPFATYAGVRSKVGSPLETRLMLLALSPRSQSVYWCTRDQSKAASTQTPWRQIAGMKDVSRVIGAVEYDPAPTTRYLYLFAETTTLGDRKLVFVTFDLETRTWSSEPVELKAPDDHPGIADVRLLASPSPTTPPKLYLTFADGFDAARSLGATGKDWEKAAWVQVHSTQELCTWEDASRHLEGLDNDSISANRPPPFQRIMTWLKTANDHATKKDPKYKAGFPTFWENGDSFGVLMLTDQLVDVRPSRDLLNDFPTVSNITEVCFLISNATNAARTFQDQARNNPYQGALPLFEEKNQVWKCENIACIKRGVSVGFFSSISFMVTNTLASNPNRLTGLVWRGDFDESDFAWRFRWADNHAISLSTSVTNLRAFPTFRDVADDTYIEDICYFPMSRANIASLGADALSETVPDPYKPAYSGPFELTPGEIGFDVTGHRSTEATAYAANQQLPPSISLYLDEAWYFVRVHVALQLQRAVAYREALDWFRVVYDATAPVGQRKIAAMLVREESAPARFQREANWNWLRDPLDPHRIAQTRANSYTRFTLLAIIRCLLDDADNEFTRDTAESLELARRLYEQALELLDASELDQRYRPRCEELIGDIEIRYGDAYDEIVEATDGPWWHTLDAASVKRMAPKVEHILAGSASTGKKRAAFKAALAEETEASANDRATMVGELVRNEDDARAEATDRMLMRDDVAMRVASMNNVAMNGVNGSDRYYVSPEAAGGSEILGAANVVHVPAMMITACVPPNPVLRALRLRAEMNLYKIRSCRNIAGVQRELEAYAAPTDTVTGMPSIGAGGQLVVPGLATTRPTPYRYRTIIERAKQMVQLAQQVETSMLSALQQRDAEAYSATKARQDVQRARAGVTLQDLRVAEADDETNLAELQRDRATIQALTFEGWLSAGMLDTEKVVIGAHIAASALRAVNAAAAPIAGVSNPTLASFAGAAAVSGAGAAVAEGIATIASLYASFERRRQEWELNRQLARQDIAIGNQQIRVARDRARITGQERVIAQLDADNAEQTVEFLANKFTSVDLYDWMAGVLEGVYRYFLQQATAMAQLAASQLGFERQEPAPPFIQTDYWTAPSSDGGSDGPAPDRKGLTGSARLLQDIYQLDQYWFDTNRRKLQLTKTISLAQNFPIEFQQFRETGVITFATPMDLFDADFPGHYLRLIKGVRTSVIALIPPIVGIKASLTSGRLSRVVTGGDVFQTARVQHGPDLVALTSPHEATGLFDMEQQSDMLAPFEGIGVDTFWEFRMPRAANPFDYQSIADVMLTFEYTALHSFDYRQQVTQRLRRTVTGDRAYSFRDELNDCWYDLHNPDLSPTPMTVTFRIEKADFPPHLDDIRIAHLALYVSRKSGSNSEVAITALSLREDGTTGKVGGAATTNEGLVSTRRGNAGSWMPLIGKSPVGQWELALPNNQSVRALFAGETIEDVMLVVTYSGRLPPWPS